MGKDRGGKELGDREAVWKRPGRKRSGEKYREGKDLPPIGRTIPCSYSNPGPTGHKADAMS